MLNNPLNNPEQNASLVIDNLAAAIAAGSIDSAEMFKEIMGDRWLVVVFEFIYFYIHLMNRVSLNKLGDEGRRNLYSKVLPRLFSLVVDAAVTDRVSAKDREHALAIFTESNYDRESIYSACTKYVSPENPLDHTALFSRLALTVIDACGFPQDETVARAVIGISYKTYEDMNLVALVEAGGRKSKLSLASKPCRTREATIARSTYEEEADDAC